MKAIVTFPRINHVWGEYWQVSGEKWKVCERRGIYLHVKSVYMNMVDIKTSHAAALMLKQPKTKAKVQPNTISKERWKLLSSLTRRQLECCQIGLLAVNEPFLTVFILWALLISSGISCTESARSAFHEGCWVEQNVSLKLCPTGFEVLLLCLVTVRSVTQLVARSVYSPLY